MWGTVTHLEDLAAATVQSFTNAAPCSQASSEIDRIGREPARSTTTSFINETDQAADNEPDGNGSNQLGRDPTTNLLRSAVSALVVG
jgi:hypothetical protein